MLEQQDIHQQIVSENIDAMKRRMIMKTIDKEVLAGYNSGIEKGRLHHGLGLIEFERTKEILLEELPPPPAVIYDIGGGYGEYSFWLTALGYEVYLYDIGKREKYYGIINTFSEHFKETLRWDNGYRVPTLMCRTQEMQ